MPRGPRRIRYGSAPWLDRLAKTRRPTWPKFTGDLEVPVVVVGAGLAGCQIAYAFAAAGIRTVVVEAGRVGQGATASETGLFLPHPGADFLDLEATLGRRAARATWQAARRGSLECAAAIRRLNIACRLRPCDVLQCAMDAADVKRLRKELQGRQGAGLDATWVVGRAVRKETGFDADGAIRLKGAATFDPYKATLGFARAAVARGATIFEQSAMRRVRTGRHGVEVELEKGVVRSDAVVIATGDPTPDYRALKRHFTALETYAVMTPPLPAAVRSAGGGRSTAVIDSAAPPHRLYWTTDNRIIWSGADQARTPDRGRDAVLVQRTGQLMYELSLALPVISGIQPEYGWHGPYSRTPDGLPFIGPHRNYPRHLFALGLGANPTSAWLASRILLRHYQGETEKADDHFGFGRFSR